MSTRVRILIADDHDLVRKAIACLLSDQPDFEVIGQAADGRDAVEQVQRLRPMHDGEAVKSAMREAGAIDYVEKSGPIERLFTAIRDAGR